MNIGMLQTLTSARIQDLQHDSRDCRRPRPARPAPRRGGLRAQRATGMRSRVGYTLVEAGLRLVATSGPHR